MMWFLADALTMAKVIPAVVITICAIRGYSVDVVFGSFIIGELLDAFDGMAAHHWPHPEWTDRLWFRRHLKLLESGLDMLLAVTALIYVLMYVNELIAGVILVGGAILGTIYEFIIYGRLFGTPENCKEGSLMQMNPRVARKMVAVRFIFYLVAVAVVGVMLFVATFQSWATRIVMIIVALIVGAIIGLKKFEDGRLDDVRSLRKK